MKVILLSSIAIACCAIQAFAFQTDSSRIELSIQTTKTIFFTENHGQLNDVSGKAVQEVLYQAAAPGIDIYLTTSGLIYVFHEHQPNPVNSENQQTTTDLEWIRMDLQGAAINREHIVADLQGAAVSHFFSPNYPNGIMNVPQYNRIRINEIYPGIDWVLYGSETGGMKYDFIVHPGADPDRIRLLYESEQPLQLDQEGAMHITTRFGKLSELAPYSYLQSDQSVVRSAYQTQLMDAHRVCVTYSLGNYSDDEELVIDPQLVWGTRIGNNGADVLQSITHDSNGNLFIAGSSASPGFPLLDAGTYFQPNAPTGYSVVVLKFNREGVLLWSTAYGGSAGDFGTSIVCDPFDNIFVGGVTGSADFPLQNTGTYFQPASANDAAFILKFDNNGNRLWATCYGGNMVERIHALTTDNNGNIYAAGYTFSADFPVQSSGGYTQTYGGIGDAFLLKFDNTGNRIWATLYGGNGEDLGQSVSCSSDGTVYVGGYSQSTNFPVFNSGGYFDAGLNGARDAFLVRFDGNGNRLWATYIGGAGSDELSTVAVDPFGNPFISGYTRSTNFPVLDAGTYFDGVLGGEDDQFILKLNQTDNLVWGTYYGGNSWEHPFMLPYTSFDNIDFDDCGNVYISFLTSSPDVPTYNPGGGSYFDGTYSMDPLLDSDVFLTRFTNDGTLTWATYLGGMEYNYYEAMEIGINNELYLTGIWGAYTSGDLLNNPGNGAFYDSLAYANNDGYIFRFIPDPQQISVAQTPAGCSCNGTATVTVSGGIPPYSFNWSNGVQTTNTLATTQTVTGICAGTLWVEVTSCGQSDTVFFDFPSGTPPAVQLVLSDSTVCPGTPIIFTALVAPGTTANWLFGDGQSSAQLNPVHVYTASGTYDVSLTLTDAGGCSANQTFPALVTVYPQPVAAFTVDQDVVFISDPEVQFTDLSLGASVWQWLFGDPDGGTSTEQHPEYEFPIPGTYNTQLVVANSFQCTDTANRWISVAEDFAFFVPNAFTPNGDRHNDVWQPCVSGINTEDYFVAVYNRWGECVWSTTDWQKGWDGLNAVPGVYTWIARVVPLLGVPREYDGFVTVVQ